MGTVMATVSSAAFCNSSAVESRISRNSRSANSKRAAKMLIRRLSAWGIDFLYLIW